MSLLGKWRHRHKVGDMNIRSTDGSVHSSNASITDSRLNIAIMDLLGYQENISCTQRCRGRFLSPPSKRTQLVKLLIVVLLPFIILAGSTSWRVFNSANVYLVHRRIVSQLSLCEEWSILIWSIQQEQGISAMYGEKLDFSTKESLLSAYTLTNGAIANISTWPSDGATEFQSGSGLLTFLNWHRYNIDVANVTLNMEITFYKDVIEHVSRWFLETWSKYFLSPEMTNLRESNIWKSLVAIHSLMSSLKYHGEEKAIGLVYYVKGSFLDRRQYLQYSESRDNGIHSLTNAFQYSVWARKLYDQHLSGNDSRMFSVMTMRNDITNNFEEQTAPSTGETQIWMTTMGSYLDIIHGVQLALSHEIRKLARDEDDINLTNLAINTCILVAIVAVALFLTFEISKHGNSMENYTLSLVDRTKAVRREKKRTNTILKQIFPTSLAIRLGRNEKVDSEECRKGSLMFSEMVGFNDICRSSSPHHVIATLNKLYSCYDDLINRYDAFKVSTVSDIYLITSGLTHVNTNHAREIACLSIDILRHANQLEIPHHPGIKIKLRIGCHTGPIMTGVVGKTLPKYCVFGKTVDVASRIQALSTSNGIHISEDLSKALKGSGSFEMELRTDEEAKNDGILRGLLGDSVVTYWLKNNTSMVSLTSLSSISTLAEI